MSKPKGDYVVGKGRPPVETRFRPGRSGNIGGRPKGAKGINTIVKDVLNSKVTIVEGHRKRTISKLEFIVTRLANDAAQGKPAAVKSLLDLIKTYPIADRVHEAVPPITSEMTAKEAADLFGRTLREVG